MCKIGLTQTNDKLNARIAELKEAGIDTTVVYYKYCVGTKPRIQDPLTPCEVEKIRYLMWQQHGKSWLQRFDECKNHQQQPMKTKLMDFTKFNFKTIITDSIPEPEFEKNGINNEFEIAVKSSHYCDHVFLLKTDNREYVQTIYEPYIYKKSSHNRANTHYKHNMRSPLKTLVELIKKEPYINQF